MIYQRELYDIAITEIPMLIDDHHEEANKGSKVIPLDPDFAKYEDMIMNGSCALFGMRDDEGKLQGYASWFLYYHPHHKELLFAGSDMIYVVPEHRTGHTKDFIDHCVEELKDEGCNVISISLKVQHDHPQLMQRCGFEPTETVYSKYIG